MKNNKINFTLVDEIKNFIPTQIVMKAVAYANPKSIEKTIINIYDKTLRAYMSVNPRFNLTNITPEVEYEIHKIINCRILVE